MSARTGKRLDASTIDQYMHKSMAVFRSKFGHSAGTAQHRDFFKTIDEKPGENWFSQLCQEVENKDKKLKRESGVPLVGSKSPPLHRATHLECMDQLSLMNTKASMQDKLVMMAQRVLCNRASDTGNMLWEDIKVDDFQSLPRYLVEEWEVKVSEQKPVPLLPSNDDPRLSILLALGDSLCVGGGHVQCSQDTPTKHHLFPALAEKKSASTYITVRGVIADLCARFLFASSALTCTLTHPLTHTFIRRGCTSPLSPASPRALSTLPCRQWTPRQAATQPATALFVRRMLLAPASLPLPPSLATPQRTAGSRTAAHCWSTWRAARRMPRPWQLLPWAGPCLLAACTSAPPCFRPCWRCSLR